MSCFFLQLTIRFNGHFDSRAFCDFGENFEVIDATGEAVLTGMVAAITTVRIPDIFIDLVFCCDCIEWIHTRLTDIKSTIPTITTRRRKALLHVSMRLAMASKTAIMSLSLKFRVWRSLIILHRKWWRLSALTLSALEIRLVMESTSAGVSLHKWRCQRSWISWVLYITSLEQFRSRSSIYILTI